MSSSQMSSGAYPYNFIPVNHWHVNFHRLHFSMWTVNSDSVNTVDVQNCFTFHHAPVCIKTYLKHMLLFFQILISLVKCSLNPLLHHLMLKNKEVFYLVPNTYAVTVKYIWFSQAAIRPVSMGGEKKWSNFCEKLFAVTNGSVMVKIILDFSFFFTVNKKLGRGEKRC